MKTVKEMTQKIITALSKENNYSDNTLRSYSRDLTQYLDFLNYRANDFNGLVALFLGANESSIRQYLCTIQSENNYASSTMVRRLASLRSVYEYMVAISNIPENPVPPASMFESKIPYTGDVTAEEMDALRAIAMQDVTVQGQRNLLALDLIYATGMKVGTLVGLNVDDVQVERSRILRGNEIFQLHSTLLEQITNYIENVRPILMQSDEATTEKAMFVNHRSRRISRQWIWDFLRRIGNEAGIAIPLSPQVIRNSFAVHQLSAGVSLKELQEMLGHAHKSTTYKYARDGYENGHHAEDEQVDERVYAEALVGSTVS